MSELRKIVAARIRQCRQDKGWTLDETARRLSDVSGERFTVSRYSNWEQELRMPMPEQIIQLGEVFGKPPAWMQGFTSNDSLSPVSTEYVTANSPSIPTKRGVIPVPQASNATAYHLEYIERRGLNKNKLLAIRQLDGSMAGVIEEGAEVLLSRDASSVQGADLFGIVVNGSIWIRWIKPQIDGTFTLSAQDRAQYPDEQMTAEQLEKLDIVGRVCRISHDR